jgi:hypothetical protein
MIAGNARFTQGEEVLVFLERHPVENVHFVMGMAQGKYVVDRNTVPPTVKRTHKGLRRVEKQTLKPALKFQHIEPASELSNLADFVARIRNAMTPRPAR